ncbi:hypothetical protein [Saccharopolyspora hirsuta]|uniref:hypothetical protein n=1 Tax=Saccharopolyspora hirsuta TaxID=1837 RepID=UPI001BAD05EF|nr:hypothetical protein [Saccharopolyspora hirsuta]
MSTERARTVVQDLGPDMEWLCEMEWPEGVTTGGPGMLVIRPAGHTGYPAGGISSTLLREIDFRGAVETLRDQLASSDRWAKSREESAQKLNERLLEAAQGGITPEYLALLSRVYVGSVNEGQDKPLAHLAELTGKSASAIKNHLWQATRKGFLERSPGRAGGKITEKAAAVLKEVLQVDIGMSPAEMLEHARETQE